MGYENILVIRWSFDSFEGKMAVLILTSFPSPVSFSFIEPLEWDQSVVIYQPEIHHMF